ncbi:MAG: FAD-binding oxidoreductase [Chloroflexota bacterium]|nr:FAD-binding oxidoreductase [Chloroflexota bacterium]
MFEQAIGVASGRFAGRQQVDGRFRFSEGHSVWPADQSDQINIQPGVEQIQGTLRFAAWLLTAIHQLRMATIWGGLLDLTPKALPVLERSQAIDGLVFVAGFSGDGFCLGPITGQILADLTIGGSTELPIEPFALSRFATAFRVTESLTPHGQGFPARRVRCRPDLMPGGNPEHGTIG